MPYVLIVDDARDSGEALQRYLQRKGYEVECVPNGREAVASVIHRVPDLVILDLLMPELDGPSFLEVARSYLRLESMPVILLTALSEGPLVDRARHAKVNAILVKSKATFEGIERAAANAIQQLPT